MNQSIYELQSILILWAVGFVGFLCTFYVLFLIFERRAYISEKVWKIALVSFASGIGTLAAAKILSVILPTINLGNVFVFNQDSIEKLGFVFVFFVSIFSAHMFLDGTKKPKHDQSLCISIDVGTSLKEMVKIVSEKFPNVSPHDIWITSQGKYDKVYFHPYPFRKIEFFTEYPENFATAIVPFKSLGHVITLAKMKDPTMKKASIFFLAGALSLSIDK